MAAIEGEGHVEIIVDDDEFCNDCIVYIYKELENIGYKVEVLDTSLDDAIDSHERKLASIESKIENILNIFLFELSILRDQIREILLPNPEYVATYEWLSDAYEGKPLVSEYFDLSGSYKLNIIKNAEYDGILSAEDPKYEWQRELKLIILSMQKLYLSATKKTKNLRNKINNIADLEYPEMYYRELSADEDVNEIDILSLRIVWNDDAALEFLDDSFADIPSPKFLSWVKSDYGQFFLDFINDKIIDLSKSGVQEYIFNMTKNSEKESYTIDAEKKISAPSPGALIYIYNLLGFHCEKLPKKMTRRDSSFVLQELVTLKVVW